MKAVAGLLYASVVAAAFLAFAWPCVISRDQDSAAYHAIAVGVLLVFFASLFVLCLFRLRGNRGGKTA